MSKAIIIDLIIIISMICIFFSGFAFYNKLSVIVNPKKLKDAPVSNEHKYKFSDKALILGNINIVDEIAADLKKRNILTKIIHDTCQLDTTESFDYLIALSENDLDNLMICSICRKFMGINQDIALCNINYNKKLYEDNNIPYLLKENLTADLVVLSLLDHHSKGVNLCSALKG